MTAPSQKSVRDESSSGPGKPSPVADFEARLLRVAASEATVLLQGENGAGKSRAALRLHRASARRDGPFVETNVSALASTLVEAELFGHDEGAYTGAHKARAGRFALAHGGTLVLDGVEDLSESVQVKLLRVLQERVIEPLGGTPREVDVRVIATTSEDLLSRVELGDFREDFYYRLAVVTLELPPLRERLSELPELVAALSQSVSERSRVPARCFGADALEFMSRHRWPGNLRELENAIERVLVLGADSDIDVELNELEFLRCDDVSGAERIASLALAEGLSVEQVGMAMILAAVQEAQGNLSAAARRVGLSRRALEYRLRHHAPNTAEVGDSDERADSGGASESTRGNGQA